MKEERTAGPLHTPCSCTHLAMPLAAPPSSFLPPLRSHSPHVYALLTAPRGCVCHFPPGDDLCSLGPVWPLLAHLRSSGPYFNLALLPPASCLVSTLLLSTPLRACHLTAHSVPHWLVLSITIYLLLEWQQPLHLTSLFHQLWIDYWM